MNEAVLQSIRMAIGWIQEEQRSLLVNLGLSVKSIKRKIILIMRQNFAVFLRH